MSDTNGNGKTGASTPIELMTMAPELREEFERGLRFAHVMLDVNQRQGKASATLAQALANLLLQRGLIAEEELKEALAESEQQAARARQPQVRLGDMGDKYAEGQTVEIDCANRIHLCQARCCTFKFYLTKQDLDEGAARWDYGNPYWIKQAPDGYCAHCDPNTRACTIHDKRPHVCRQFDCRNDKRIWIDFEQRIPAPMPKVSNHVPIAMLDLGMREYLRQSEEDEKERDE